MLPLLVGSSIGLAVVSAQALMVSGTAGTGYGLGRKYGRIICEQIDRLEGRVRNFVAEKKVIE